MEGFRRGPLRSRETTETVLKSEECKGAWGKDDFSVTALTQGTAARLGAETPALGRVTLPSHTLSTRAHSASNLL